MADSKEQSHSNAINERILNDAITQLKALDLNGAETVQINHTRYDDSSSLFEVSVAFLTEEDATDKPTLDELVAGITAENRHEVIDYIQRSYD